MLLFHETTQRRVCRVLFLICGVLPALLTCGWIGYVYRPWRLADWQQTLSHELHVRVTVGGLARPRPGVTRLDDVCLADLHSGRPLARLATVTGHWEDRRLCLAAEVLEVEVEQLPQLARALGTWMATSARTSLALRADRLKFVTAAAADTAWSKFQFSTAHAGPSGFHVRLQAQPTAAGPPVRMRLASQSADAAAWLQATLDVRETGVPAWLLAQLVPGGWQRMGAAKFQGQAELAWHPSYQQGTLQGRLVGVDLARWLGDETDRQLQGVAHLELRQVVWQDQQLQRVEGSLQAASGRASPALLVAAEKIMGCTLTPALHAHAARSGGDFFPFDELAFRFQLSRNGIQLAGACAPGGLMVHQNQPLVLEPSTIMPLAQLVQLLHLPVAGWLPDTQAAQATARGSSSTRMPRRLLGSASVTRTRTNVPMSDAGAAKFTTRLLSVRPLICAGSFFDGFSTSTRCTEPTIAALAFAASSSMRACRRASRAFLHATGRWSANPAAGVPGRAL